MTEMYELVIEANEWQSWKVANKIGGLGYKVISCAKIEKTVESIKTKGET